MLHLNCLCISATPVKLGTSPLTVPNLKKIKTEDDKGSDSSTGREYGNHVAKRRRSRSRSHSRSRSASRSKSPSPRRSKSRFVVYIYYSYPLKLPYSLSHKTHSHCFWLKLVVFEACDSCALRNFYILIKSISVKFACSGAACVLVNTVLYQSIESEVSSPLRNRNRKS